MESFCILQLHTHKHLENPFVEAQVFNIRLLQSWERCGTGS